MSIDGKDIEAAALQAVGAWLHRHPAQVRFRDELFSDAQLGALKGSQSFDEARGVTLRWWLRFKARGEMVEGIRARSTMTRPQFDGGGVDVDDLHRHPRSLDELDELGTTEGGYEAVEARATLGAVLHLLTPRQRQVVVECDLRGRDQCDVAREFGITPGGVCRARTAALRRMRQAVAA